ncbi:MAG: hypothetical protein K5854_01620 [Prevotella sp.]|nr:hypothetical protein [Prevotella sp.]
MKIEIEYEYINVAPRFYKAIYRKRYVRRVFTSCKEARKAGHNLRMCKYYSLDENDDIVFCLNTPHKEGQF